MSCAESHALNDGSGKDHTVFGNGERGDAAGAGLIQISLRLGLPSYDRSYKNHQLESSRRSSKVTLVQTKRQDCIFNASK